MQPYYVVPLLIEQPTWGGNYIASYKKIADVEVTGKKIGQAFELFDGSFVSQQPQGVPAYGFATPATLNKPLWFHQESDCTPLQSIIDQNPEQILGRDALAQYGKKMGVLIKFTQAQNNSYQAHVKIGQEFSTWQAKPESWYFLEPGKATLGLKAGTSIEEYQQRCIAIDQYAQELSRQIQAQKISVSEGKKLLHAFIDQDHPRRFVNTVQIKKNQVVDISGGGIHHSWEMGTEIPQGNIVYEVQKDVKDEVCTLRSFDQGNIKDDGKVRPLSIPEYFQAIDRNPDSNDPRHFIQEPQITTQPEGSVTPLFHNQFYCCDLLTIRQKFMNEQTDTQRQSFHHLFVQSGAVTVQIGDKNWPVQKGWSLLIPASVGKYSLLTRQPTQILKTWVSAK